MNKLIVNAVAEARFRPRAAFFTTAVRPGGAWPVNAVEVVNEDRTVNVVNGAFTDTFQGETVHI